MVRTLIRHRATYSLFIFFKLSDVISRFTLSLFCTDLTYKHSFIWSVYIYTVGLVSSTLKICGSAISITDHSKL